MAMCGPGGETFEYEVQAAAKRRGQTQQFTVIYGEEAMKPRGIAGKCSAGTKLPAHGPCPACGAGPDRECPRARLAEAEELERLRTALADIKAICAGDRAPNWIEDGYRVTVTRGRIMDIVDGALQQSRDGSK